VQVRRLNYRHAFHVGNFGCVPCLAPVFNEERVLSVCTRGIGRESTWRFLELLTFASLSGRDVLKHSVLVAVLRHMHRKDKPMFLLDTHSSRGMFKLTSPEAMRSPEHLQGPLDENDTHKLRFAS
jgi:hypothetical protein